MQSKNRQTWVLAKEMLPCGFPANQVDLTQAMDKSLSRQDHYARYGEVTDFIKQSLSYHIKSSGPAYVDLAVMSAGAGLESFDGWEAKPFHAEIPGATELVVTKPGMTGGYHVSLRSRPTLTEDARASLEALEVLIEAELNEKGVPENDRFLRQIIKTADLTPSETNLKNLMADPKNYRATQLGDQFNLLIVTALNIGGPPDGVEASDTNQMRDITGKDVEKIYLAGSQVKSGLGYVRLDEDMLSSDVSISIGGSAEVGMAILSGLLKNNGLEERVSQEAHRISSMPWRAYGDEKDAEIMDAANACMFQSNGLFDPQALDTIHAFSRGLALHDMILKCKYIQILAEGLVREGFDRPENAFDPNDLRDVGHALESGGVFHLFSHTQNGKYRVDLHLDDSGSLGRMDAYSVGAGSDVALGRFKHKDGVWHEDYDGKDTGLDPVVYNIKNIRHMNNLMSSLGSMAAVFEMEYLQKDASGPQP